MSTCRCFIYHLIFNIQAKTKPIQQRHNWKSQFWKQGQFVNGRSSGSNPDTTWGWVSIIYLSLCYFKYILWVGMNFLIYWYTTCVLNWADVLMDNLAINWTSRCAAPLCLSWTACWHEQWLHVSEMHMQANNFVIWFICI